MTNETRNEKEGIETMLDGTSLPLVFKREDIFGYRKSRIREAWEKAITGRVRKVKQALKLFDEASRWGSAEPCEYLGNLDEIMDYQRTAVGTVGSIEPRLDICLVATRLARQYGLPYREFVNRVRELVETGLKSIDLSYNLLSGCTETTRNFLQTLPNYANRLRERLDMVSQEETNERRYN